MEAMQFRHSGNVFPDAGRSYQDRAGKPVRLYIIRRADTNECLCSGIRLLPDSAAAGFFTIFQKKA